MTARSIVFTVLVASALFLSCRSKAPVPEAALDAEVARTMPADPHQPMNLDKPDQARVELDLAAARGAVRTISQVSGANPKSLEEMGVRFNYPADLDYDPSTGTVKSKTYPRF